MVECRNVLSHIIGEIERLIFIMCLQSGIANSLLVGEISIRQLRVRGMNCGLPNKDTSSVAECVPFYGQARAHNLTMEANKWHGSSFESAEQTGAGVYNGRFAHYGGGGYVERFRAGISR